MAEQVVWTIWQRLLRYDETWGLHKDSKHNLLRLAGIADA